MLKIFGPKPPPKPKQIDCLLRCEFQELATVYRRGGVVAQLVCEHGTLIYSMEVNYLPE